MTTTLLRLGHSPDPDDAFMFYALAHGKIDTGDLRFEHILKDIETLNQWARKGRLEITAVSVHAYAHVHDKYAILDNGASMGDRYGPIVIAREALRPEDLAGKRIAVPGTLTTALLTLRLAAPPFEAVVVPFDEIMAYVAASKADAGLLIHEGQLTYKAEGFHKALDLGEWWAEATGGLPLPLGCDVVRKDLGPELMGRIARILQESIEYGLAHREDALAYAMQWGRGLSKDLADRFVGMYVNRRTLTYDLQSRRAMEELLRRGHEAGLVPGPITPEYVLVPQAP